MELLNLPHVGRNDNFFLVRGRFVVGHSPGHSSAGGFGGGVELAGVFHQPTLHAQAALVDEGVQATKESTTRIWRYCWMNWTGLPTKRRLACWRKKGKIRLRTRG